MLTANVIDEIKAWRDELGKVEDKPIYYSEEQKNYLIQILNDNKFIFSSQLSSAINFGEKNDPFIIAPLKKADGKEKSEFNEIIEIDRNIAFYQKYMEYLASEKAYELNVAMEQTPQKKTKTSSIQKIYSTNKSKVDLNPVEEKKFEEEDIAQI